MRTLELIPILGFAWEFRAAMIYTHAPQRVPWKSNSSQPAFPSAAVSNQSQDNERLP
jgi:hypothetical protein